MQVTVAIEMLPGEGFRASARTPFDVNAEGKTRDEVLERIRQLIDKKLTLGYEVVQLDVPTPDNPWLRMAGMWDKDDTLVAEWKEIMHENRLKRERGEEPHFPWENSNESLGV